MFTGREYARLVLGIHHDRLKLPVPSDIDLTVIDRV